MPFVSHLALDGACDWFVANVTRLDICSQEPTNYTEASSTYSLGNRTGQTMTGPTTSTSPTGRKVTFPAVSDGTVTGDGTARNWAISKPPPSEALGAAGALAQDKAVTTLVPFSSTAIDVTFRDSA